MFSEKNIALEILDNHAPLTLDKGEVVNIIIITEFQFNEYYDDNPLEQVGTCRPLLSGRRHGSVVRPPLATMVI